MTAKVYEVVRTGTWVYGETVTASVRVVRRNYFDGPKIIDEEPAAPPPTNVDGCFYSIEYDLPGAGRGSSGRVYGSLGEAMEGAEEVLRQRVAWGAKISN